MKNAIPVEINDKLKDLKTQLLKNYFGKFKVVKRTSKYVNGKAIQKIWQLYGENSMIYKFVFWNTYPQWRLQDLRKIKKKTDIKDYVT
nr:hypothetical protein [Mycoplasmopsis bovis]